VGDGSKWGYFQVGVWIMLDVIPWHKLSKALVNFFEGFCSECHGSFRGACQGVGTSLDGCGKVVQCPLWATVSRASGCGALEEKIEGRVVANGAVWAH